MHAVHCELKRRNSEWWRDVTSHAVKIGAEKPVFRPRTHGNVFLRFCIVYCSQGNREQPAHYLKLYKNAGKRFRVYGASIDVYWTNRFAPILPATPTLKLIKLFYKILKKNIAIFPVNSEDRSLFLVRSLLILTFAGFNWILPCFVPSYQLFFPSWKKKHVMNCWMNYRQCF